MSITTFSVIVTCYNYKAFVIEAVDSALAQTRAATQIIVVDDGSTDGSTELLRSRYAGDSRVELVCTENGGQLAAFQRGLARANADVVCFLDADDVWRPDYLARIGEIYDARRDIDFVFSDIALFGNEQRTIGYAERAVDFGYTVISTYLTMHWYGAPTSALSLRHALTVQILDLPESFGRTWRLSADNCLVYGASLLAGRKYYLPTGSVGYRIHGANGWWSNRSSIATYFNKMRSSALIAHYARIVGLNQMMVDLVKAEFKTKPDPTGEEIRRYARLALRTEGSWLKRRERALSILAHAYRKKPRSRPAG